jgi:hypothetical protein
MTFRIDRIKVNRAGPLESDFEFEPGDLNLIYGKNETGKTYVVESLIKFLFKTNSRAPVNWNLRGWDIAGRAIVSGLKSDPVTFTTSGQKLEDYWEDGLGLPRDLSRLLVVRAGETLLADAGDGVGRDILKDYLSGEGLLDSVLSRISATLQKAEIQASQIIGNQAGELKARDKCGARLSELQRLIDEVEESYASGDAYSLRKEKEALDAHLETLGNAKRYHAAQLHGQVEGLQSEQRELPAEGDLARLEADVATCESNRAEIETKSEKLQGLESTSTDYKWAGEALGVYKDLTSGAAGSSPNMLFVLLTLIALAGTVASSLLGFRPPLIVGAVLSVVFGAMTYLDLKKAAASAGENTELEKLKTEYRIRFGSDLTDQATLQAKLGELNKNEILVTPLREALDGLSGDTRTLERKTTATLKAWTGNEIPAEEWRETIRALTGKNGGLQDQIDSIGIELTAVGVPGHEYVEEDPGEKWDSERYAEITKGLSVTDEALKHGEKELKALKFQAHLILGTTSENSDLGDLITDLGKKRDEVAQAYREHTAEVLAKIQVKTVIEEFRLEENSRIAEGLERDELTEPLQALTGRYRSIRLDDEKKGLVLTSDKDEDYPLDSMSTGAREQVFLALRMGFASIAMEGQTGFLILDDAFQHSDWNRRENLVTRTLSFVQSGWQVFYFTMDDHIKGLFEGVGDKMGDGFKSHSLG